MVQNRIVDLYVEKKPLMSELRYLKTRNQSSLSFCWYSKQTLFQALLVTEEKAYCGSLIEVKNFAFLKSFCSKSILNRWWELTERFSFGIGGVQYDIFILAGYPPPYEPNKGLNVRLPVSFWKLWKTDFSRLEIEVIRRINLRMRLGIGLK